MLNSWPGDIALLVLLLAFPVAVVLPLQLLLCHASRLLVRALPALILCVLTAAFSVLSLSTGWEGLSYLFLALLCAASLLMSGVAWVIWAFLRRCGAK